MGDEAKSRAKKLRKMDDDELMRELALHEDDMDDLVAAEYQRRSLAELHSMSGRLSLILFVNLLLLVLSVAATAWAVATYAWWVQSEGDWSETRRKSRESMERARKTLEEGADSLSAALEEAREEVMDGRGRLIGRRKSRWSW